MLSAAFSARVDEHQRLLRKRGFAMAAEDHMPTGHAALWHQDAAQYVPRSGRDVAKQLARLAGDDSCLTIPWRSLADAVGVTDSLGRHRAYAERGVAVLIEAGWLRVETIGRGRGARTTFYLLPGDRAEWFDWMGDDDLELADVA